MALLRIASAKPLESYRLELRLTDGSTIERDVGALLVGPVLDEVRRDPAFFRRVGVEAGTAAAGKPCCHEAVVDSAADAVGIQPTLPSLINGFCPWKRVAAS